MTEKILPFVNIRSIPEIDLNGEPNHNKPLLLAAGRTMVEKSGRSRGVVLMHENGSRFQYMVNIISSDSYIQPHKHVKKDVDDDLEGIEIFSYYDGEPATVITFDEGGKIDSVAKLGLKSGLSYAKFIPSGKYHTVVVPDGTSSLLEIKVVSLDVYLPNNGYDHKLDKTMAPWAPSEDNPSSAEYLRDLQNKSKHF